MTAMASYETKLQKPYTSKRLLGTLRHLKAAGKFASFAAIALVVAAVPTAQSYASSDNPTGAEGDFTPLPLSRILDTRTGNGGYSAAIPAGKTYSVQVAGRGGVPGGAAAQSVVLSLVAVAPASNGFMTVYSTDMSLPRVSSMNFTAGKTIGNQVTVPLGKDGKINIHSSATTHLLADVTGFYSAATGPTGYRFHTVPATRIMDTRNGNGGRTGQIASNTSYDLQVAGRASVPTTARAAVINLTVVTPDASGSATVWPTGSANPGLTSLNMTKSQTTSKLITVALGKDGKITIKSSGTTAHYLVDVSGYYSDDFASYDKATQAGRFSNLLPQRVFDSRTSPEGRLKPSTAVTFDTTYTIGKPTSLIRAVLLNITAVSPSQAGNLTVWASGTTMPTAPNITYQAGQSIANQVIVPVGKDGTIHISSIAGTDVVADLGGYFIDKEDGYNNTYNLLAANTTADITVNELKYRFTLSDDLQNHDVAILLSESSHAANGASHSHALQINAFQGNGYTLTTVCQNISVYTCRSLDNNAEVTTDTAADYAFISMPFSFTKGTYQVRTVIATNATNMPGRWATTSVTNPSGTTTQLYAQYMGDFKYEPWVTMSASANTYSCEAPVPLSISIGNMFINGTSYTLSPYQEVQPAICKGYLRSTTFPGSLSQSTVYRVDFGVPVSQRDTTGPAITNVQFRSSDKKIVLTVSDTNFVERVNISFDDGSQGLTGSDIQAKSKTTAYSIPTVLASGTHTAYITAYDSSGNTTTSTLTFRLP